MECGWPCFIDLYVQLYIYSSDQFSSYLVTPKIQKLFKILYHIKPCGTCTYEALDIDKKNN